MSTTTANSSLQYDRSAIMRQAWARYRKAFGGFKRFVRDAFREALRLEWVAARSNVAAHKERARIEAAKALPKIDIASLPVPVLSQMEAAIDALKYLPSRISAARAEAQIRAAFSVHA